MSDSTACGTDGPLLRIDLDRLRQAAVAEHNRHQDQNFRWRPTWSGPFCDEVTDILVAAERPCDGLAFGTVAAAARFAAAGGDALTLWPPATAQAADRLAAAARRGRVTVACDHFLHAELMSAACRRAGSEVELLVRVDAGRQRLGVRPGPDLSHFVCGAMARPAIRVGGLLVDRSVAVGAMPELDADETGSFVARCRERLAAESCGVLASVGEMGDLTAALAGAGPSEARTSPPSGLESGQPWAVVLATVVGRPTRDVAVLDVGRAAFGRAPVAVVHELDGARVAAIADDVTVLELSGESESLLIGDRVALIAESGLLASRLPIVVRDGDRWRRVR